jgi:secreted trypsin-like serine protease
MQGSTSTRRTPGRSAGRGRLLAVLAALLVSVFVLFLEGGAPAKAIVGGDKAKPHQYPFMVQLLDPARGDTASKRFFCGGTLTSPRSVLTAAHCFLGLTDERVQRIYVRVGSTRLGRGVKRGVLRVWIHGGFNMSQNPDNPKDLRYDVATITLKRPVREACTQPGGPQCGPRDFTNLANPSQDFLERPETLATVVGWGWTQRGKGPPSPVLREVHITLRSDAYGESAWGQDYARALMIAAGRQWRGAEHGDSGGPLLVPTSPGGPYKQIGIASFVNTNQSRQFVCDRTNLLTCPDVYTEVNNRSIHNFILEYSGR